MADEEAPNRSIATFQGPVTQPMPPQLEGRDIDLQVRNGPDGAFYQAKISQPEQAEEKEDHGIMNFFVDPLRVFRGE